MGDKLWTALQPIVDAATGHVVAHEALLRGPEGTDWESPLALFAAAERLGHRTILEANARHMALSRLSDIPPYQRLFINIDVMSLDMPVAPGYRALRTDRVVLEISERQPIVDNPHLVAQVHAWRAAGFTIALDDYGAGYMGLGALLKLRPDLLKLDRVIIHGVTTDAVHRAAVRNMVELGRDLSIVIVAEGVETAEEYSALRDCGVQYMQGYLFGRPQYSPAPEPLPLPAPIPQERPVRFPASSLPRDKVSVIRGPKIPH